MLYILYLMYNNCTSETIHNTQSALWIRTFIKYISITLYIHTICTHNMLYNRGMNKVRPGKNPYGSQVLWIWLTKAKGRKPRFRVDVHTRFAGTSAVLADFVGRVIIENIVGHTLVALSLSPFTHPGPSREEVQYIPALSQAKIIQPRNEAEQENEVLRSQSIPKLHTTMLLIRRGQDTIHKYKTYTFRIIYTFAVVYICKWFSSEPDLKITTHKRLAGIVEASPSQGTGTSTTYICCTRS